MSQRDFINFTSYFNIVTTSFLINKKLLYHSLFPYLTKNKKITLVSLSNILTNSNKNQKLSRVRDCSGLENEELEVDRSFESKSSVASVRISCQIDKSLQSCCKCRLWVKSKAANYARIIFFFYISLLFICSCLCRWRLLHTQTFHSISFSWSCRPCSDAFF